MSYRMWWRTEDVLPLAETTIAAARRGSRRRRRAALLLTSGPDGLSMTGSPGPAGQHPTAPSARAETWVRPATAPPAPEYRVVLPLRRYRIGRRSLWRLLRKASLPRLHWISITVDPSRGGRLRYEAAANRDDVLPPGATWTPMAVTCHVVAGGAFRALVADGHTSVDDGAVLARFPRYAVQLMATHLDGLRLGDMPGEHPLRFDGATVVEWEHDELGFTRRIECDRISPDANGCYAIGAYQWPWAPLPTSDDGTHQEDAATGQDQPLPPSPWPATPT